MTVYRRLGNWRHPHDEQQEEEKRRPQAPEGVPRLLLHPRVLLHRWRGEPPRQVPLGREIFWNIFFLFRKKLCRNLSFWCWPPAPHWWLTSSGLRSWTGPATLPSPRSSPCRCRWRRRPSRQWRCAREGIFFIFLTLWNFCFIFSCSQSVAGRSHFGHRRLWVP